MTYPIHPAANLIPQMDADQYADLRNDIRDNGLKHEIVLWEEQVLDGVHRQRACDETGREPRYHRLESCISPTSYVLSANLFRRHLTRVQAAAVAANALPMFEAEARERQAAGRVEGGKTAGRSRSKLPSQTVTEAIGDSGRAIRQAAAATGAGIHSTETMAKVKQQAPEVFEAAMAGEYKSVAEVQRAAEKTAGAVTSAQCGVGRPTRKDHTKHRSRFWRVPRDPRQLVRFLRENWTTGEWRSFTLAARDLAAQIDAPIRA